MANTQWNPADKTANVTLSNTNLTATQVSSNCAVRSVDSQTIGKYYWEVTMTSWFASNTSVGVANAAAVLSTVGGTGANDGVATRAGPIIINAVSSGFSLGARTNGNVIGIALDRGAQLIWFRVAPAGNWNGSGTADPAAGTGGASITAIAGANAIYALWCCGGNGPDACTANFGDSAFSGVVPSGYTAGFPLTIAGGGTTQARAMVLA